MIRTGDRAQRWARRGRAGILLLGALAVTGCRRKSPPPPPEVNAVAPAAHATPAVPADTVVATVNERHITAQEVAPLVEERLARLAANPDLADTTTYRQYREQRRVEFTREATDSLIADALLDEEIARRGITVTDAEVEARIATVGPTTTQDPQVYRRRIARDLALRKLFAPLYEGITVTDAEAEAYYRRHARTFNEPERVRASHIQLGKDQRDLAERLAAELREGADFATLARTRSQDALSAERGGDLGLFAREDMEEAFAEAAFGLEVGQTSGVVASSEGLHLIRVTERHPAVRRSFAEVRDQIVARLTEQKQLAARRAFVKTLREKAHVEVTPQP